MSPFSAPFFWGAQRRGLLLPKRAAALWEGTQRCEGGTGKAEAAKLPDAGISLKQSYKRECQETFFPVGSVPTLFLSRHSAQPFERALVIEWSCSGDVVSCFVSSHETVRSFFLPVVPFHCRDGAIRF